MSSPNVLKESWKIQAEASAMGFDWPEIGGVLDKIAEELEEIRAAIAQGDRAQAQRELGDLLLAAVNTGRFLDIDPAVALEGANKRFTERFAALQNRLSEAGIEMKSCSLDMLDEYWNEVKVRLRQ
jgi:nucleoside triphosphate diphosphatase